MIHECNVNCRSMDLATVESLGIEDPGKWLSFCIDMKYVYGIKLTSDDETDPIFNCTTLYAVDGDTYIIDTPFEEFKKLFITYKNKTNGHTRDTRQTAY